MPRKKTRPLDDEPTATKKKLRALRKKHKGDGTPISPICDLMVTQIESIQQYTRNGQPARAEFIGKQLQRSMQKLAGHLAVRQ